MNRERMIEVLKKDRDLAMFNPMTGECVPMNEDNAESAEALSMAIAALEKAAILNGNTLTIKVSEEDIDKVKRVMLDSKPWCRMFYEDAPGEAHWIKSYTPDDGEIYECDNCGVTWQFNDGGPEENEAHYCPKCGFKMVPKEGEQNETD